MGIHHNVSNLKEVKEYPRRTELCPNCFKYIFERKDFIHGHYFCENCGFLTKEILVVDSEKGTAEFAISTLTKKRVPDHFVYPKKNISRLRKIYEKESNSVDEYRLHRNYKHYLDIIASSFQMTPDQKAIVFDGLKKAKGVNYFCKNCGYEKIILALSIMVMRNDDRKIRFKDYKLIKEVGLKESNYIKIIEKASSLNYSWS